MDANQLTDEAAKVAEQAADKAGSVGRTLVSVLGRLVNLLSQLLTILPAVPSRVLATLATALLRAGEVSAETAGIDTPVERTRKSSRRKSAVWFVAGFAAGGAAGYGVAQAQAARQQGPEGQVMSMQAHRDSAGAAG